MYLPYLRCKSEEINSIIECPKTIFENTLPIFEPIGISKLNLNKFKKIKQANIPFILIINPQIGSITIKRIMEEYVNGILADYDNYSIALIIHNKTLQFEVDFFHSISNLEKSFIHKAEKPNINFEQYDAKYHIFQDYDVSKNYIKTFTTNNKIILTDGFKKKKKNADYEASSFFSDKHLTYKPEFSGVADYLIQGDNFSESGGPAAAVAIHITEVDRNTVFINHFISDNKEGQSRIPEKFKEAIDHLINYANKGTLTETAGLQDYYDLHERKHFPGLPMNKRIALKHHIETIAAII